MSLVRQAHGLAEPTRYKELPFCVAPYRTPTPHTWGVGVAMVLTTSRL
jgi:hypothetical protein